MRKNHIERGATSRATLLLVCVASSALLVASLGHGRGQEATKKPKWDTEHVTTSTTVFAEGTSSEVRSTSEALDKTVNTYNESVLKNDETAGYEPFCTTETFLPSVSNNDLRVGIAGKIRTTVWLKKAE